MQSLRLAFSRLVAQPLGVDVSTLGRSAAQPKLRIATRVLAALFAIWALGGTFLWQQHRASIRFAEQNTQHLAFVMAEIAEQSLTINQLVIDSMLDWIAEEDVSTEAKYRQVAASPEFFDRLTSRTQNLSSIDVATFIANDGSVLNFTRSYPPPQINLADRDYFLEQVSSSAPRISLGKAVRNRGTAEWTFYLSRAVYGTSGDKLGVAIVGAGVPYYAALFRRMLRSPGSSGFLVRDDGVLLAATSDATAALGTRVMPEQESDSPVDSRGLFGISSDGPAFPTAGLTSASRLTNFPAYAVAVTDRAGYLVEWWQTVWAVLSACCVLSLASAAVGWRNYHILLGRDQTLRQEGERRILSAIFGSPLALAALVTPGRRVLYSNSRFSAAFRGTDRHEALALGPEVEGSAALIAFLEGGELTAEFTLSVRGKDCSPSYLRFSGARVDLGQGENAIALLGYDDTQRMKAEAHIIQSSKLITLGEMATSMAHELNQPLNVIKMAAQSALFEIEEVGPLYAGADAGPIVSVDFVQFLESRLQRVVDQVDRAATIIDHMRIFGRAPIGQPPAIDAAASCRSTLQLIGHQLRDAQINIVLRTGEESHMVKCHPVLLEQVLVNLLLNARDALAEVSMAAPEICIEVERVEHEIIIAVTDNGPGILPILRDRIFEPFFTTKSAEKGTGLGLSVSYGIVRDSGGRLELLDRSPGCTFRIVLPAVAGSAAHVT